MNKKIQEFVGKIVKVNLNSLLVDVEVIDVKSSYGKDRYQITPVSGEGEVWVENIIV